MKVYRELGQVQGIPNQLFKQTKTKDGRQYNLVGVTSEEYSRCERVGFALRGTIITICTIGFGLFSSSVRNDFKCFWHGRDVKPVYQEGQEGDVSEQINNPNPYVSVRSINSDNSNNVRRQFIKFSLEGDKDFEKNQFPQNLLTLLPEGNYYCVYMGSSRSMMANKIEEYVESAKFDEDLPRRVILFYGDDETEKNLNKINYTINQKKHYPLLILLRDRKVIFEKNDEKVNYINNWKEKNKINA